MKRVVLVFGMILVAVMLFAAGPHAGNASGVPGTAKQAQSKTGDLDGTPDQDQFQDGSCQDSVVAATPLLPAVVSGKGDQLKDGTGDLLRDRSHDYTTKTPDRIRLSRPTK